MQEFFPRNGKKRTANAVRDEFPPVGNAVPGVPTAEGGRMVCFAGTSLSIAPAGTPGTAFPTVA